MNVPITLGGREKRDPRNEVAWACVHYFQIIRMLAEKAKQQEEMLVEYDDCEAQNKDMESEVELLRAQVDSMKEELKVGNYSVSACFKSYCFNILRHGGWIELSRFNCWLGS